MEIIKKQKRKFTSLYKARVALEALSGKFSIQELMEKFDLNRKQILNWKEILISKAYIVFEKEEFENKNSMKKSNPIEKKQIDYQNEIHPSAVKNASTIKVTSQNI